MESKEDDLARGNDHPVGKDDFDSCIADEQGFLAALVRTIGVPPSDAPDILQSANLGVT